MLYDFDEPIDRRHTHSEKWDDMELHTGVSSAEGIPMWVADMDFKPPQAVNEVLAAALAHGVHSYFGDKIAQKLAIAAWMQTRHGWAVEPDQIATTHGVVAGLAICLNAFSAPGDGVILLTPVYHAFARTIKANNRRVVECLMTLENDRYTFDLDALSRQLDGSEKLLVLCSPHNPNGRVWTREELRALAFFAEERGIQILSDEIHADLVWPGHKHLPLPVAVPELAHRFVVLTAATKTFNLAGTVTGHVIIADPGLRARFAAAHVAAGTTLNRLGVLMTTAAYQHGAEWLNQMLGYLDTNRRILDNGLNAIRGVRSVPLEATYLGWIDFTRTGLSDAEIAARFRDQARVAVSAGPVFGSGGSGFVRVNFATRRHLVEEAVARLQSAFSDLQ